MRDGLAAFAVTEHLGYQPHAADIPNKDRNRAWRIAEEQAGDKLLVFNGSEITRDMPPGHVNAVFLKDANRLLKAYPEAAIKEANAQGAFVFWNHPYWTMQREDGIARLEPMHERLIAAGQLHGVEVANGADFSEAALQIALDHNLAILGTSDIHGLIDWDYDLEAGERRTVTLALAKTANAEGIREALVARRTVALYRNQLIGRPQEVTDVVRASLKIEVAPEEYSKLVQVKIKNASSVRYALRVAPEISLYNSPDLIAVPPNGAIEVLVSGGVDAATFALPVEILNAIIAPSETLKLTLTR